MDYRFPLSVLSSWASSQMRGSVQGKLAAQDIALSRGIQYLFARAALDNGLAKPGLAQGKTQARQQVEMSPDCRAGQREQRMDRLAVDSTEIDGVLQEADRHHRAGNVHHYRAADMRDGDAFPHAGRAQRFARQEHLHEELPVDLFRQGHEFHNIRQHGGLCRRRPPDK